MQLLRRNSAPNLLYAEIYQQKGALLRYSTKVVLGSLSGTLRRALLGGTEVLLDAGAEAEAWRQETGVADELTEPLVDHGHPISKFKLPIKLVTAPDGIISAESPFGEVMTPNFTDVPGRGQGVITARELSSRPDGSFQRSHLLAFGARAVDEVITNHSVVPDSLIAFTMRSALQDFSGHPQRLAG